MNNKVLLVDDDPDLLATFSRLFRKQFRIDTALAAGEGLKAVEQKGPYAVIVSDMKMPGMDGIQFLSKVKEIFPDSVRIMLTGNADQDTAVQAVNEGSIFRFLSKPCSPEAFSNALTAGIEQYRLITAERELLEKTLSRSIKVLVDILSIVNPMAFSRSVRLKNYVHHIARQLKLRDRWQYEIAALLSQIGSVTLPAEIFQKQLAGQALTEEEQEMFNNHPKMGRDLLIEIPRIELIAQMIGMQQKAYSAYDSSVKPDDRDPVILGAQMLKVASEFEQKYTRGMTANQAVDILLNKFGSCDPIMVRTLRNIEIVDSKFIVKNVAINDLNTEMIINESIATKTGMLVVHKEQEISFPLLERLKNYRLKGLIGNDIRVLAPRHNVGSIKAQ